MSKRIIVFFIFLLSLVSCKSTYTRIGEKKANYIPYYLRVYEADSLFIVGNHKKSYEVLDSLFKKYEPINILFYNEYNNFVKLSFMMKDKNVATSGLRDLVENYGLRLSEIKKDTVLNDILKVSELEPKYNKLRERYLKKINVGVRGKILEMKLLDQKFRGKNALVTDMKKQAEIDSLNSIELKRIFNEIGYPNSKKIGVSESIKQNDLDLTVVLLHTDSLSRKEYFLPKIAEFVKRGECSPEVYGYMYDQMLLYSGKPQKYGTYTGSEIASKDSLNYYRKEIGLPSNNYAEWRMKVLYNLNIN